MDHLAPSRSVPSMNNTTTLSSHQQDYYAYRNPINSNHYDTNNNSLQDMGSIDHLDQHSLLDYASRGSSSMFSLTVSDSSPATPSQQSLFYDSTLTTSSATSFPPSPHYSMDHQQQYHQSQRQQQLQHSSINNDIMLNLPIAPTLPANTSMDSHYYTHPCMSTVSFQDSPLINNTIHQQKLPSATCGFNQGPSYQDQATMNFYGSYTPSSTQYSMTQPY
ncbi:hypothetical protein BC941DRAFT_433769 [Chlamydoabsidia padenii]|nr:hypothetical protein BC941DRAFT_433769 [Chlamydoabsidia padenii]